jgi:hypothetical protein
VCRSGLSLTRTQYRGGWLTPQPARFTPENDPVLTVQKAGWATGPVWVGAENISPAWIRSSDRANLTESLYRLNKLSWPLTCRQTIAICHDIKFLINPYNGSLTFSCDRGIAAIKKIYVFFALFYCKYTEKYIKVVLVHITT